MMTLEGRWIFSREQAPVRLRIEIRDGLVVDVREEADEVAEGPHSYIAPGFLDAQVNGYNGNDYSLPDLNPGHIEGIVTDLAKSGATRQIATIVTSPQDRLLRNIEMIAGAVKTGKLQGAIPGIHLEGPYISEEDGPRGAHDRKFARDPDIRELDEWISAAGGLLCVVTLAPERKGSCEFIEALVDRGIVAAIGHTGASPEDIRRAIDAGASLSTHLGNGSHAMLPRLKNYLWEQLADDRLSMGLISDGFHVPAPVAKCLVRAKGLERTILVSDVALYGGMAPGRYSWGNVEVEVFEDGHLGVADTPYLAGAGHLLSWSVPRFIEFTSASITDAVRCCTTNPAKLFGLGADESVPVPGQRADFVQFSYEPGCEFLSINHVVRGTFVLE